MMRAAVLTGAGKLKIEEVPLPEPAPGQVRIRLEGCGVCASNLTPWEGPDWMHFPTEAGALGHEGWGVVDAIGHGVSAVQPGERVGFLSGKAYAEYDLADASLRLSLTSQVSSSQAPCGAEHETLCVTHCGACAPSTDQMLSVEHV